MRNTKPPFYSGSYLPDSRKCRFKNNVDLIAFLIIKSPLTVLSSILSFWFKEQAFLLRNFQWNKNVVSTQMFPLKLILVVTCWYKALHLRYLQNYCPRLCKMTRIWRVSLSTLCLLSVIIYTNEVKIHIPMSEKRLLSLYIDIITGHLLIDRC